MSERDLTKLAFQREVKNVVFFSIGAGILYFVVGPFGFVGRIIGWGAIALYALFALESLFALATTVFAIIAKPGLWRLPQAAIAAGSVVLYLALAGVIYAGMYGFSTESVHTRRIPKLTLDALLKDFRMSEVLAIIKGSPNRTASKEYLGSQPRLKFFTTQEQDSMILNGYTGLCCINQ